MQKSFVFDIAKCTGCSACKLACEIENGLSPESSWREVNTFNELNIPDIKNFHLSLACNHCIDPPCMKYCPALAYSKDQQTGAVTINPDKCIGCKYCSWVCPYNAPVFNSEKSVMEKCTFCNDRLHAEKDTACVEGCPTGALKLGKYGENKTDDKILGFPDMENNSIAPIEPAIEFKGSEYQIEGISKNSDYPYSVIEKTVIKHTDTSTKADRKIDLKTEWTLLIFTFLATILVSISGGIAMGGIEINPYLFLGLGALGMGISTLHLGNKELAYRAVLNWRHSWISREIIFFSLFLALSAISLIVFPTQLPEIQLTQSPATQLLENQLPATPYLKYIVAFFGFATLFSMDKVYQIASQYKMHQYHSGMTFISALFLVGIFAQSPMVVSWFGMIKLFIYSARKSKRDKSKLSHLLIISISRIFFGFLLPAVYWYFNGDNYSIVIFSVLLGEFIDRLEFYLDTDFITPKKQMNDDLITMLDRKIIAEDKKQKKRTYIY